MGLINRIFVSVLRKPLFAIYNSFIRSHLNYGDVIYDKPKSQNFQNKLEKVQYTSCLAITGTILGTSRKKITMN